MDAVTTSVYNVAIGVDTVATGEVNLVTEVITAAVVIRVVTDATALLLYYCSNCCY